eukprot:TRINITY_DN2915_c0_g1_i1.p1 TRINITY_DN2915_c0_g1~~TRINITY_DN2915_c0_g1_i1.p1  ORF type:complete len:796 (+),score=205.85 TRINITY_DN2915_c0_g1_i1:300-2390(+)
MDRILSLYILLQLGLKNSKWSPYLRILPNPPPVPFFWDEETMKLFKGTPINRFIDSHKKDLDQFFSKLPEIFYQKIERNNEHLLKNNWRDYFTISNLYWAFANIYSRSFLLPHPVENFQTLVPVIDLLNHDHRCDRHWIVNYREQHFQISADSPVEIGTDIFLNYGTKSNEELLLQYGFSISDNPFDKIFLSIVPEDIEMLDIETRRRFHLLRRLRCPFGYLLDKEGEPGYVKAIFKIFAMSPCEYDFCLGDRVDKDWENLIEIPDKPDLYSIRYDAHPFTEFKALLLQMKLLLEKKFKLEQVFEKIIKKPDLQLTLPYIQGQIDLLEGFIAQIETDLAKINSSFNGNVANELKMYFPDEWIPYNIEGIVSICLSSTRNALFESYGYITAEQAFDDLPDEWQAMIKNQYSVEEIKMISLMLGITKIFEKEDKLSQAIWHKFKRGPFPKAVFNKSNLYFETDYEKFSFVSKNELNAELDYFAELFHNTIQPLQAKKQYLNSNSPLLMLQRLLVSIRIVSYWLLPDDSIFFPLTLIPCDLLTYIDVIKQSDNVLVQFKCQAKTNVLLIDHKASFPHLYGNVVDIIDVRDYVVDDYVQSFVSCSGIGFVHKKNSSILPKIAGIVDFAKKAAVQDSSVFFLWQHMNEFIEQIADEQETELEIPIRMFAKCLKQNDVLLNLGHQAMEPFENNPSSVFSFCE